MFFIFLGCCCLVLMNRARGRIKSRIEVPLLDFHHFPSPLENYSWTKEAQLSMQMLCITVGCWKRTWPFWIINQKRFLICGCVMKAAVWEEAAVRSPSTPRINTEARGWHSVFSALMCHYNPVNQSWYLICMTQPVRLLTGSSLDLCLCGPVFFRWGPNVLKKK